MSNNQTTKLANLCAIDEQLFAEVTPEQAVIVEGGLRVQLSFLRCIKAGADGGSSEEVFASYNGIDAGFSNGPDLTFARPLSMRTNSVANVASSSRSNGSITVSLFDKDSFIDDPLGSFTVSSAGRGTRRVSGSGSTYEVGFSAF